MHPGDLVADARGGVYVAISGSGVFYANPKGVVAKYGEGGEGANGIILSREEKTLYVTNGAVVLAFDLQADGALANQREFGKLRGGQAGDGSAVDAEGRLYVATGELPHRSARRSRPRRARRPPPPPAAAARAPRATATARAA